MAELEAAVLIGSDVCNKYSKINLIHPEVSLQHIIKLIIHPSGWCQERFNKHVWYILIIW